MALRDWSSTAANNNSAAPDGAPEGWAPSAVNNTVREIMAQLRAHLETAEWFDYGDAGRTAVARKDGQNLSLSGTNTLTYAVGRRVRVKDTTHASLSALYGTITGVTFSGGTQVTVELDTGSFTATVTAVALGDWPQARAPVASPVIRHSRPRPPGFLAQNSTTDTNQTGNGATATVDFDSEIFDNNGDFAADVFTAPAAGRYVLSTFVTGGNFGAGANNATLTIVTSNRTYRTSDSVIPTSNIAHTTGLTVVADMDEGDTASVRYSVSGMAGNTVSILGTGGGGQIDTFFSGLWIG